MQKAVRHTMLHILNLVGHTKCGGSATSTAGHYQGESNRDGWPHCSAKAFEVMAGRPFPNKLWRVLNVFVLAT